MAATLGRPLMELMWVRIDSIDGEHPADLYGTIKTARDGTELFNVPKEKSIKIYPGDFVLLTGPDRYISALDAVLIPLGILGNDTLDYFEQTYRAINWNPYDPVFDKPLQNVIEGVYGSMTVQYVVFRDAVQATLEVKLLRLNREDGKDFADVYGDFTVRIANIKDRILLFKKKKSEDHIHVRPGQIIPLLRYVVAVPLNSHLIVQAHLCDHDIITTTNNHISLYNDYEIANGTQEFTPQCYATFEKRIFGQYGEIQVKVTFIAD